MIDREKVMWSLSRCSCGVPDACSDCHYDNWPPRICVHHLTSDAYALLKEQEPRLLSVEEVVGYVVLKRDITLWFEFRNGIKEMNAKDIIYNDFLYDEDFPTLDDPNLEWKNKGKRDGVIIAEYNDTFRCWTSRPTEKQSEAVKWSD